MFCSLTFQESEELLEQSKKFICVVCDKKFLFAHQLKYHSRYKIVQLLVQYFFFLGGEGKGGIFTRELVELV